jgi:hypothetical protein
MHVRDDEEEFSLSQPVTASVLLSLHRLVLEEEFLLGPPVAVPPEEVEVPVVQGPSVMVPPEEEEFLAPAVPVSQGPPVAVSPKEEEVPAASHVMVPPEGRGCLVPILALVSSSPLFFSQKRKRFFSPFFLINVVDLYD